MAVGYGLQVVAEFGKLLEEMLDKARAIKQTNTIEPPLNKSDLAEELERIESTFPKSTSSESKKHAVETATRDTFNNLLVRRNSVRATGIPLTLHRPRPPLTRRHS